MSAAACRSAWSGPMRSMVTGESLAPTPVACPLRMRLFIAVWPPPEVVARMEALPRPAEDGVRWTTPDQWHVTLRFFGSVPSLSPVVTALEGASLPGGVVAVAGPALGRFGARVLHV